MAITQKLSMSPYSLLLLHSACMLSLIPLPYLTKPRQSIFYKFSGPFEIIQNYSSHLHFSIGLFAKITFLSFIYRDEIV